MSGRKALAGAVLLLGVTALCAQTAPAADHGKEQRAGGEAPVANSASRMGAPLRVIRDPNIGDEWVLCRNPLNPGGPGRLVRLDPEGREMGTHATGSISRADRNAGGDVVIHAGDRIVVEEKSAVMDARLTATALEPARLNRPFRVRLQITGKTLNAIAVGNGRAELEPIRGVDR